MTCKLQHVDTLMDHTAGKIYEEAWMYQVHDENFFEFKFYQTILYINYLFLNLASKDPKTKPGKC